MTATLVGASIALGVVFVGLGFALRVLSRYTRGARLGGAGTPIDVVARVGLGPRQGLAIVRVGERGVMLSVGEGGIRPVLELSGAELAAFTAERRHESRAIRRTTATGARWIRTLRSALAALAMAAVLVTGSVAVLDARTTGTPTMQEAERALPAGGAPAAGPALQPGTSAAAAGAALDSLTRSIFPPVRLQVGEEDGLRVNGTVGAVLVIGLMTLLPTLLLLMTSFTRILVVLHFLRQALGTQNAPPAHLLAALALLLTGFVMAPTLEEANRTAFQPWIEGTLSEGEMLTTAAVPFRSFMLRQTRESDLETFVDLAGATDVDRVEDVPFVALVSAFAIGELRTAFQIGFAVFLPFIVIDLVVAAVLTSMGMFMLPPTMIALPLKLMLFVLVDGWSLVVESLVSSFF